MKRSISLFLFTILFLLFGYTKGFAIEQLTVSKITRISHPVYRAGNLWYGVRDPWNRDYTRIMLYENTSYTDPGTGKKGRGMVWGFINNLKNWSTLTEYESAAKPFPKNSYWAATSLYWSPFPGEENIIYGIYTSDKTVSKLNVDTGVITPIISYDPGDGTSVSTARSFGWTTDNKLVVNFDNENFASGGYEIDVQTRTRVRYSSPAWARWPQTGHGHGHKSPDRLYNADYVSYSGQNLYGVVKLSNNERFLDKARFDQIAPVNHVSWKASNDWYLGSGVTWKYGPNAPALFTKGLFQIIFDRTNNKFTYNTLFTFEGPAQWWDETKQEWVYNWHTHPLATLRSDGFQVFFTSTDGKFSYDDYQRRGVTPWGTEGYFLADLISASSPTPPPPPPPPPPAPTPPPPAPTPTPGAPSLNP
ncbi:MAG: hypothetical protein RDU01_02405 [Thermodesulfovibrionales bacterium]|nr:hypothetical protein [Thermodesulfovibrionales bacterium]